MQDMGWHDITVHAMTPLTLHELGQDILQAGGLFSSKHTPHSWLHIYAVDTDAGRKMHRAVTGNMAELAYSPLLS